jgi:hypothetical protein
VSAVERREFLNGAGAIAAATTASLAGTGPAAAGDDGPVPGRSTARDTKTVRRNAADGRSPVINLQAHWTRGSTFWDVCLRVPPPRRNQEIGQINIPYDW